MIHFRIFSGFSLVSKLGLRFSLEFCSKFIPALFANDMLLPKSSFINFQIDTNWRELLPFFDTAKLVEFVRQSMYKVDIGLGPKLENWSLCCCPQYLASESQQEIHTFNGTSAGNKMWLAASIAHQKVLNQGKKVKNLGFSAHPISRICPSKSTLFENYWKCRIWIWIFGIFHQFLSY